MKYKSIHFHCHSLFMLFLSVWSVGNIACRLRDPHQGTPSSSGLQYPSVPQGWSRASLPAHLPGVTGMLLSLGFHHTLHPSFRDDHWQRYVCLKEHRDEYLTAIPQEVCLSFVKIIQEVLGSPPDLDLLKLIYNFLLAVHPPTNTYVCHTPSSFYFSLHIGEEAPHLKAAHLYHSSINLMYWVVLMFLFVRWEAVPGESAVHYVSATLQQRRKVCQQLCVVPLPGRLPRRPWRYSCFSYATLTFKALTGIQRSEDN